MAAFEISSPRDEADIAAMVATVGACFCLTEEHARQDIKRVGVDNVLLVRRGGEVLGGLYLLPMGQWFGSRSVPTMGIAAVGILPEHRGSGAAKALMLAALAETRRRGIPLSTLYPATHTLYRRCGYELAGGYHTIRLDPAGAPAGERELTMRRAEPADAPHCEKLYQQAAAEHAGWIDRSPLMWLRIHEPWDGAAHSQVVLDGGAVVGYLHYRLIRKDAHHQVFRVLDMVAGTRAAGRRLLAFFGDHRSLVKEVIWHGPPNDPLLLQLPERTYSIATEVQWMLRLVDAEQAMIQRGYSQSAAGEVHFEIEDAGGGEPAGGAGVGVGPGGRNGGTVRRWVLRVAGGAATTASGGRGEVRCDVGALAALYTGFMTAGDLARAGRLSGGAGSLAALAAIFAGDAPGMLDVF